MTDKIESCQGKKTYIGAVNSMGVTVLKNRPKDNGNLHRD